MRAKRSSKRDDYIESLGGAADADLLSRYACRVTENVSASIQGDVHDDPIAKQYIPTRAELDVQASELDDPIGDYAHTPVKGIVHRYPDRVLFKPANVCAVYCRYCFRREMVGPKAASEPDILNAEERDAALDYIAAHPEIWEVILTGGDPLVLSPKHMTEIMSRLASIEHVKIVRFHTRVPIADPARVTDDLCSALVKAPQALYMALHINHAQEITSDVRAAIARLRGAGVQLVSQSVLLRGVNDDAQALEDLYRALLALSVQPYYLHHPDLAPGTAHFRLPIAEGLGLVRALRGRLSGLCQPRYMLDIPGGYGKIDLNSDAIKAADIDGHYMVRDYKGRSHLYPPIVKKEG
jgi:lysine 2,3-aminomutase